EPLAECGIPSLSGQIGLSWPIQDADAPHPVGLLRSSWEWQANRCAAKKRDELASFQLTERHPIPLGPGPHRRISDCSGSVSGLAPLALHPRCPAKPQKRPLARFAGRLLGVFRTCVGHRMRATSDLLALHCKLLIFWGFMVGAQGLEPWTR